MIVSPAPSTFTIGRLSVRAISGASPRSSASLLSAAPGGSMTLTSGRRSSRASRMPRRTSRSAAASSGVAWSSRSWPTTLQEHYGEAFSIARRLAGVFTVPKVLTALGPVGMRSDWLMTLALRWMGNLVTDDDRDRSARVWRWAGRRSIAVDARPPFS